MARSRGSFNFSQNFEVFRAAPLDARQKVQYYTDLVLPSTWEDAANIVWLYNGAIVVVTEDPSAGVYWLQDVANYTSYDSWVRVGSSQDITPGVINIGDGSANIFAGYDASGNILIRTFQGSGAAEVTQTGDNIVIGIDASFSGEVNFGENIGDGDASIYKQKVGDALEFKTLKAGSNIILDSSDNVVVISSTGGSGESIDGGVWISDITATGSGNVGDKVTTSSGEVLESCITDTTGLTVSVIAVPGHSNYEPSIAVYGTPVTNLTLNSPGPQWTGSANITFNFSDTSIGVVHEDGASWYTTVSQDTPAVILGASFENGYPGSQTELKAGDTFDVSIVTDVPVDEIEFGGAGFAPVPQVFNVTAGTSHVVTVTISDQGTTTQDIGFQVRVRKPSGSVSSYFLSTSQGSTDGKYRVKLNNSYPSVSIGSITYPASQSALKNTESANVANTVTVPNGTLTYLYTSPNGQLNINTPSTYQTSKLVNRIAATGDYNVTTTNFTLTATRDENNASDSDSTVVYIANVAPTLTVVNGSARFRSGGNDGTSPQNHTITIQSDQRLQAAPTLASAAGGGTWQGTGFSWSSTATSFTRQLQVHDDDVKGTYSWGAISGTGLAGLVQTTNSGAAQYVLGGFVERNLTVAAYGTTAIFNTEAVDYSKISNTLNWGVKSLPNKRAVGTTATPDAGGWAINTLNINPTTINILDTQAASSSSQPSTITGFEETI